MIPPPPHGPELKRVLNLWDSISIMIGIVIGVGIFRVPMEVSQQLSSPAIILLAWLTGGVISLLGAFCYMELASRIPQTGGNYLYLRESYGHLPAFLFGWTELLVIRTGSIAAVAFIFAEYLVALTNLPSPWVKPSAIVVVCLLASLNTLGLTLGKQVQNTMTLTKLVALMGIILAGLCSSKGQVANLMTAAPGESLPTLQIFFLALIPILWTYGGWHENTFVAGETKDPQRTVTAALLIGTLTVTLLYLAMNAVYLYLIPISQIASSQMVGLDVLRILSGPLGGKILSTLILVSAAGVINALLITGSRLTYAMAQDHPLFGYLTRIDERHQVPSRAILLNALVAVALIIWGTFERLLFFTGIVVWIFFGLVVAGLFRLRQKWPDQKVLYKVWGYPLTPLLFILICAALALNTLTHRPYESAIGLILMFSGIPIFLLSRRH